MKTAQTLNIAIVESSDIVRYGLTSVLDKLPDLKVTSTEISSIEGLHHCFKGHNLDIVIINPTFGGWFNLKNFKATYPDSSVKFVAILCSVTDNNLIKDYDDSINLYDSIDELNKKLVALMRIENESNDEEYETLSQREKEIIYHVVKGMTNKEIADKLCISVHTVMTHRRNISKKLQIHTPAGLTIFAIVNKIVELDEVSL